MGLPLQHRRTSVNVRGLNPLRTVLRASKDMVTPLRNFDVATGHVPLSGAFYQLRLSNAIERGTGYLVARPGVTELQVARPEIFARYRQHLPPSTKATVRLRRCAPVRTQNLISAGWELSGIFPPDEETARRFSLEYLSAIEIADDLVDFGQPGMGGLLRCVCPDATVVDPLGIEPFWFSRPWTRALEGKTVLLVGGFADMFAKQYERRHLLWTDTSPLPDCTVIALNTPMTQMHQTAGFASVFDAMDQARRRMADIDFDVALVAAGGIGMPLAAEAKRMGKVGVYVGGVLQILFGLKGERWEQDITAPYRQFFNPSWTRPDLQALPPDIDMDDNSEIEAYSEIRRRYW
jgi:hypothetical protein